MNYLTAYFFAIILLSTVACRNDHDRTNSYVHDSSNQYETKLVDNPYVASGLNHGLCQSPINILSKKAIEGHNDVFFNFEADIDKIENQGHTVQLDVVPGRSVTKDGEVYNFRQIHFHTPSEHHIDGVVYPMEMHIVHTHVDTVDMTNYYLVIAILFKMGDANEFIDEFIKLIPEKAHSEVGVKPGTIKLHDMVKGLPREEVQSVYHYDGSLTTPPFSETVTWYVARHIYEASQEQIEFIHRIEGNNARAIQAIGRRIVDSE
ncbi:MAG: carbonic anhydrase family protein [Bacteroidota bacterium]